MLTIGIKTQDKIIACFIENWKTMAKNFFARSLRIELNNSQCLPDVTLTLSRLHKRPDIYNRGDRNRPYFNSIKYVISENKIQPKKFILSTEKEGSFIRTDIGQKTAVGKIAQNESLKFLLLHTWFTLCNLFYCRSHLILHAGCAINNKGLCALFIGKSGSGKSSICNLLKRSGFKTIDDDYIVLYPASKKIYICNFTCISAVQPDYIFFINKDKHSESQILPLEAKEAFKKIVFATQFFDSENQFRLDTLGRLVRQCRCFSFTNGRELKQDPAAFIRLFESALRNKIFARGGITKCRL